MSERTEDLGVACERSRRSFLTASAAFAALAGQRFSLTCRASEPERVAKGKLSVQPAVERMVQINDSQIVQLQPISPDFPTTIVQAIATDPRGEVVAVAGDDHAIRIYDASRLKLVATLQGHTDLIQTLDFDRAGNRLVSAGNDGQLILWDRNSAYRIVQRMSGTPALACVRFSPDGQELAAVGFENKVYLIGRTKREDQPQATCDCTDLRSVDYRDDGKLLAVAGRSGDLHLFDRNTSALLGDYQIHTGRIHDLRFNDASPVVVSVGEDGCVTMFDTEIKQPVRRINVTTGKLFSVCILDDQHLAVAGSNNVTWIVNASSGKTVEKLSGHTGSIAALASTGNFLFSGGYDTTLRRWELTGLKAVRDRIAERSNPIDR
ncbi:WD domain, G-beta repeat [Stieleria maiorica]|uniref:WD domain, G-beta repeat n=1 Tax=Stieleria maiorica TaxID=2795974 RepID=A0A5B9ME99_9BACT|nr:WD40 repeat domain-containing protein [Stieleria maiorica]QEF99592.1 WD domain, G-beta repeat [Stieleria maiorica]